MSYLFNFSLLIVLLCFFFAKKFNKNVSLVSNLLFTLIIMMCYISTFSFILDKLGFKLNYFNFSIFNIFVSVIFIYFIIKKKLIQKMYFDKFRFLIYSLFLVVIVGIMFYSFGFDLNVSFYSPDAAAHFLSARYFSLSSELNAEINLLNSQSYGDGFQFFFYTNLGTLFKCLPSLSTIGQFNLFVIYNFFVFYLLAVSFFEILMLRVNTNKEKIIAIIITLLYFLGYPLNTTLYGFSYWNTGILLCQFVIYLLLMSKNIDKKTMNLMLSISLFSLFCSYYLFVPIMYFCVFIFFIKDEYKNKKIDFKSFFIRCFISLLIPFVLGFSYFVLESLLSDAGGYVSGIGAEGTIFVDIISNYLLLIPIVLYAILDKKGENKDYLNNIFLYNFIYVIILFAFSTLNILSAYYFSKILYLNWMLIWLLTYKGLIKLNKSVPEFTKIFAIIYILLFSLSVLDIDKKIIEKNNEYQEVTVLDNLFSIYQWNLEYMKNPIVSFNKEDLYLIKEYINIENSDNQQEINFVGTYVQKRWFESLTDIFPYIGYTGNVIVYQIPTSYSLWETNNNYEYLLIDKTTPFVDIDDIKEIKKKNNIYKETDKLVIIQKKLKKQK